MSAAQALKAARAAGVRLGSDGNALTLEASTAPPPDVLDVLARHKAGVVALLRPANDGWSGEDWLALYDNRAGIGTAPTGPAWLHSRCWSAWYANRKAEAVAALSSIGTPT